MSRKAARTSVKLEGASGSVLDEAEYDELRAHYYDPIVQHNVELAGGRVLRTQTSPPRIDQKTPGFKALKKRIGELDKKRDRVAVWHLLRQLRAWETRPSSLGGAAMPGTGGGEITEIVDLSEEVEHLDVDKFILEEVLLTKVTVVKPDPDGGGGLTVTRAAPQPFTIKPDPEAEAAPDAAAESPALESPEPAKPATRKRKAPEVDPDSPASAPEVTAAATSPFRFEVHQDQDDIDNADGSGTQFISALQTSLEGKGWSKKKGANKNSWLDQLKCVYYERTSMPRRDDIMDVDHEFAVQSVIEEVAIATYVHTNGSQLRIKTKLVRDQTFKGTKEKSDVEWRVDWEPSDEHGDGYSLNAAVPQLEIYYVPAKETKKMPRVHVEALSVALVEDPESSETSIWELRCFDSNAAFQLWQRDNPEAAYESWSAWKAELGVEKATRLAMKGLGVGGGDVHEFAGACLVLGGCFTSLWDHYYVEEKFENGKDAAVKKAMAHIDALEWVADTFGWLEMQTVPMVDEFLPEPDIELTEKTLSMIPSSDDY